MSACEWWTSPARKSTWCGSGTRSPGRSASTTSRPATARTSTTCARQSATQRGGATASSKATSPIRPRADARTSGSAIELHGEALAEEREAIPAPQPISAHQGNPDFAGRVWVIVDVPVEGLFGPAEKINITAPADLLSRIDTHAKGVMMTRSAFLVHAAMEAIARSTSAPSAVAPRTRERKGSAKIRRRAIAGVD